MTANLQVSAKLADGKIFVVGAETVLDLQNTLIELLGSDGATDLMNEFASALVPMGPGIVDAIANVSATFGAPQPVPTTAPANVNGPRTETDNWGAEFTYGLPNAPSCPHGQRVQKKATSKAGKPYVAFVCPTHTPTAFRQKITKDPNCAPEFTR